MSGPPLGHTESLTATVGTPLPLTVWVADDARESGIAWNTRIQEAGRGQKSSQYLCCGSRYRGPGVVKFSNDKPEIGKGRSCGRAERHGF